jgi:hypothetical protein
MSVQLDHSEDDHVNHDVHEDNCQDDLDILEKRLQILEHKVQIQEIFHTQDTEEVVEN